MKKYFFMLTVALFACMMQVNAQKLDRMNWINEPESWSIDSPTQMTMQVTAKTDAWNMLPHWFQVNDLPFYYGEYSGDFEVKVNFSGDYKTKYDQAGIMLLIDSKNWFKAGIEYVDGIYNISAVATHNKSDWALLPLTVAPKSVWIKAVKIADEVLFYYSLDDKEYTLFRTTWVDEYAFIKVGMMGASPGGEGFKAVFKDFKVKHLANRERLEWAAKQK